MSSLFNTPILLLIFNRPEQTAQIFNEIARIKPLKLYIAADGPRSEKEGELKKCRQTKEIISQIDWPCQLFTLFREPNLGCRHAVSSAISWFFDQEEEGIILEDDCLPHPDFFTFCEAMLNTYRNDDRIGHIAGSNFQFGNHRGDGSYYFSRIPHIWGWASWRRAWKGYDVNIPTLPAFKDSGLIYTIPAYSEFSEYWLQGFERVHSDNFDTWDSQYAYHHLINNRLAILPNTNLITNIGCDAEATHTQSDHPFADIPLAEMKDIIHPAFILQDVEADLFTLNTELGIFNKPKKTFLSRSWKKIKELVKNS